VHVAEVLDGTATAASIKAELASRTASLARSGVALGLGTVLVGDDPASASYVRSKHADCADVGIQSLPVRLPATATTQDVLAAVRELNAADECTGFIVQLPLPAHVDTPRVLAAVSPDKDGDGLHPTNLGRLVLGGETIKPCTPRAIITLLQRHDIPITGRQVCIVGCGVTVGRPLALMLVSPDHHATVTLCNEATPDVALHSRAADVVVAAAGVAHLVGPTWVRPGATVLSVGLSKTIEGVLGDVHPDVARVAGRWARPTGGVGPMTRAMLLANVVEIGERLRASESVDDRLGELGA